MIRHISVIAAAVLVLGAARAEGAQDPVERVTEGEVSARIMAMAAEALAFCPTAGSDFDVEARIRDAERAGWPRFVDDRGADSLAARGMLSDGDVDRISVRHVGEEDGSDHGWIELRLTRVARVKRSEGGESLDWRGCGLHVVPRREGVTLVTDEEAAAGTRSLAMLALSDAERLGVSPAPPTEETTLWTFHDGGEGWRFVRPDFAGAGRLRTMRVFRTTGALFFGIYDREDRPVPGS